MLKNDLHALRHVGTHGPCVRARRMKHKCTIVRADAQTVRPYMPCNNQLVRLFTRLPSTKTHANTQVDLNLSMAFCTYHPPSSAPFCIYLAVHHNVF